MSEETKDIVVRSESAVGFATESGFELIQRQAKVLASSDLVPKEFKGNIPNCIIGLEIANRIGASPLAVLQNLYIVHGKPGWSSQFIIGAINSTGKFSPLRFEMTGEGDKRTCVAWAKDLANGDRLESPLVSMEMAKKEGWVEKAGSKWKTMPELMLRYRAATFFGRLYAPEILMGMATAEEVVDISPVEPRIILDRFTPPVQATTVLTEEESPYSAGETAGVEGMSAEELERLKKEEIEAFGTDEEKEQSGLFKD